ncbi:MAG: hypothetical protein ACRCXL_02835 [Dermatophilaceae bacterium]
MTRPAAAQVPAERVAAAVHAVPGVAGLHGGGFGEVATYLPGRRVVGVRTRDDGTEVHVTLVYGTAVLDAAERIRAAVAEVAPGPVTVSIEDIASAGADRDDLPGRMAPAGTAPGPA